MAKVRISTKYALSEEAMGLIQKGKTWWLRNRTSNSFEKFPYTDANKTFDVELELNDGEYQCGCGDYNAIDSNGRHCTQNIYFYVQDGKLHYVKNKNEFPSAGGAASSGEQPAFNPFATGSSAPATDVAPAQSPTETYVPVEDMLYCKKNCKVVTPDYTCVIDFVSDNIAVTGLDCCGCCKNRQTLYIKKE